MEEDGSVVCRHTAARLPTHFFNPPTAPSEPLSVCVIAALQSRPMPTDRQADTARRDSDAARTPSCGCVLTGRTDCLLADSSLQTTPLRFRSPPTNRLIAPRPPSLLPPPSSSSSPPWRPASTSSVLPPSLRTRSRFSFLSACLRLRSRSSSPRDSRWRPSTSSRARSSSSRRSHTAMRSACEARPASTAACCRRRSDYSPSDASASERIRPICRRRHSMEHASSTSGQTSHTALERVCVYFLHC